MPGQYQPPPTTPVVYIDETPGQIRVATAHYPRPAGYRGHRRAEEGRPPLVRLDRKAPRHAEDGA